MQCSAVSLCGPSLLIVPSLCPSITARNEAKAARVVADVCERLASRTGKSLQEIRSIAPANIEVCDLVCENEEQEAKLREIVKKAKVCISTAGPFEKHGQTLVKLCAEEVRLFPFFLSPYPLLPLMLSARIPFLGLRECTTLTLRGSLTSFV